jgi:hypothetical protein
VEKVKGARGRKKTMIVFSVSTFAVCCAAHAVMELDPLAKPASEGGKCRSAL